METRVVHLNSNDIDSKKEDKKLKKTKNKKIKKEKSSKQLSEIIILLKEIRDLLKDNKNELTF